MSNRRFTRLTNAFSKKIENHIASVALYMMYYNFGRKHQTLGTSPAVKAGLADHIWSVEEIIGLLEESEPNPRGQRKALFQTEPLPKTVSQIFFPTRSGVPYCLC